MGDEPTVTLSGGVITLTRRTSVLDLFNSNYRNGDDPAKWASFRVGSALEAVIEEGDVLRVSRFATGDFAATLFRGSDFILGIGALGFMPLADGMSIEEDPRAAEVKLYHFAADIRRSGTVFVWIDASDPNVDEAIERFDHLVGELGIVAFAGRDSPRYMELRQRVSEPRVGSLSSCYYVDVPSRFTTQQEWLSYLDQLPTSRQPDMYIRFHLGGVQADVREGEYGFSAPWHLSVARVYTYGCPGALSLVAIAKSHPSLDSRMVVESSRQIEGQNFRFCR